MFLLRKKKLKKSSALQACMYCGQTVESAFIYPENHFVCSSCKSKYIWDL